MKTRLSGYAMLCVLLALVAGAVLGARPLTAHAAVRVTLTVSDCTGEFGPGRIGTIIGMAAAGDTVRFSCSGVIPISSVMGISKNLTLDGVGQSIALDGGNTTRILYVNQGVQFTLANLTILRGGGPNGGRALFNQTGKVKILHSRFLNNVVGANFACPGAIITAGGTLIISDSIFSNNASSSPSGCGDGGALYAAGGAVVLINRSTFSNNSALNGGAISNGTGNGRMDVMTISNSTISNNAAGTHGGAIENVGTLRISNSTISNNSAGTEGGGLYTYTNQATVTISNSTVANNTTLGPAPLGSGLDNAFSSTLQIGASIVANNAGNCAGTITDQGYNLEDTNTCGFSIANHDLINTNPQLGALANNGGPTQTLALASTSPAIDQVLPTICPATDQRGFPRGNSSNQQPCDMGAYEYEDQP